MHTLQAFLFSLLSISLAAQTFTEPVEIVNNELSITIRPDGFIPSIKYLSPSAEDWVEIADSIGFWIGGLDNGGNLRLAIADRGDMEPGFFGTNHLKGIWRVTREEILDYFADYQDNLIIDDEHPAIFAWPAIGNPLFSAYNNGMELPGPMENNGQLASYWNTDSDFTSYNPMAGDFPTVPGFTFPIPSNIPSAHYWLMFQIGNVDDLSIPILSVGLQIFYYECVGAAENLDESIFIYTTFLNKDPQSNLHLATFGLKVRGLGDRYMHTDTLTSTAILYPPFGLAENCDFDPVQIGPSLGMKLLRGVRDFSGHYVGLSSSSMIYDVSDGCGIEYPQSTRYPSTDQESFNRLQGYWNDGFPMQAAGDGYDEGQAPLVSYAFPGELASEDQWTEINTGQIPSERTVIASNGEVTMVPGAIKSLTFQVSALELASEFDLFEQVDSLKNKIEIHYNDFGEFGCTSAPRSLFEPEEVRALRINPNPADDHIKVNLSEDLYLQRVVIYDMQGRLVLETEAYRSPSRIEIPALEAGIYILQAQTNDGVLVSRFVKR
ncbi:MAG: T9SS type A sorting domain-containing protein [Bacteroidota bacterium]